jgi:membrane protein implicated in regulation of membrane protease activity
MKQKYKNSFLGGIAAFILGTSCCWLASLSVWFGGATILTILSNFIQSYQSIILTIATFFMLIGFYQFLQFQKRKRKDNFY